MLVNMLVNINVSIADNISTTYGCRWVLCTVPRHLDVSGLQ